VKIVTGLELSIQGAVAKDFSSYKINFHPDEWIRFLTSFRHGGE